MEQYLADLKRSSVGDEASSREDLLAVKHVKCALAIGASLALAAATLAVAGAAWSSARAAASPAGGAKTVGAAPRAKFPSGWVGKVKYDYTIVETGGESRKASETATVTFRHIKAKAANFYEVKVGKITWQASAEEQYDCRYSASGSRPANRYDGFLDISPSPPYKAAFASPDDLQIRVLRTCGNKTTEGDATILHPFFLLMRKTAGVPVDKKLKAITGTSNGSSTSSSGRETWKYSWSFRAIR